MVTIYMGKHLHNFGKLVAANELQKVLVDLELGLDRMVRRARRRCLIPLVVQQNTHRGHIHPRLQPLRHFDAS